MAKNFGAKLNHAKGTIEITKDFHRRSNEYGSVESNALIQYKTVYPSYRIVFNTVSASKEKHTGLTIAYMKDYIERQKDSETVMVDFESVSAIYGKAKAFFLKKYPNHTAKIKKAEKAVNNDRVNLIAAELRKKEISEEEIMSLINQLGLAS